MRFTDDAIDYIAEKSIEYKLGARGLRSICEAIMTDAMFEIPSDKSIKELVVDKAYAEKQLSHSKLQQLRAA
jgi:ATP-dependent Clp protease ATP-binding subunit ClpX